MSDIKSEALREDIIQKKHSARLNAERKSENKNIECVIAMITTEKFHEG